MKFSRLLQNLNFFQHVSFNPLKLRWDLSGQGLKGHGMAASVVNINKFSSRASSVNSCLLELGQCTPVFMEKTMLMLSVFHSLTNLNFKAALSSQAANK